MIVKSNFPSGRVVFRSNQEKLSVNLSYEIPNSNEQTNSENDFQSLSSTSDSLQKLHSFVNQQSESSESNEYIFIRARRLHKIQY